MKAKQECLDKNLLIVKDGSPILPTPDDLETRFYPRNGSRIYEIITELPKDLKCSKCVLQWKYVAGNNWGMCDSERGAVGCGPQEEFRACSDIQIGDTGYVKPQLRPVPPASKPNKTNNVPPVTEDTIPQSEDVSTEITGRSILVAFLIVFLTLVLVLCILFAIYLYHYHGQKIKDILRWKPDKDSLPESDNIQEKRANTFIIERPPVPPPRTKRLSLVKETTTTEY